MKELLSAPLSSRKLIEYLLLFLLLASVLSAAAYGGYWYGKKVVVKEPSELPKVKEETAQPPKKEELPREESSDETADWKLYSSDKWGFSIKYPPQWLVSEEFGIETHFSSKRVKDVITDLITIVVVKEENLRNESLKEMKNSVDSDYARVTRDLQVDGRPGFEVDGFADSQRSATIASDSKTIPSNVYVVRVNYYSKGRKDEAIRFYEKALSTFRFLDQN